MEKHIKDYIDNKNKEYMFHGSSKKLSVLTPMLSNDSNNTKENIDTAIFLTDDFLAAIPYAFKDEIIKNSKGLNWSFSIPTSESEIKMKMKNVRIDENITGFVYVLKKTDDMVNSPKGSKQWKSYKEMKPIDVLKVEYKDYSKYFLLEK